VRTNLGRTYFFDKPSNPQRAIGEYRRALQADPKQELLLQSLAAALIETGDLEEAARRLDELEKVNPSNTELPGLRTQLEQKRNAAKEKP
jgi:predicted Zn-dependent protease